MKTTKGEIRNKDGQLLGMTPVDIRHEIIRQVDDPYISNPNDSTWDLKHPKIPSWDSNSDLGCSVLRDDILPEGITVEMIEEIARKVFLVLEGAWAQLGHRLMDFKIEFGINHRGELVVSDVIDNDSWRLRTRDWQELSKQLFRDNFDMNLITDKYALVAELVKRFEIPQQTIILWRGSEKDTFPEIPEIVGVTKIVITKSGHKAPETCLEILENLLATYPQGGVILSLIGMSNGLGPTLAARTSWPVIAVALSSEERPHDVWSSLEVPRQVPLLTTLSPKNAVLSALNILAQKNPVAYMYRQYAIEQLDK